MDPTTSDTTCPYCGEMITLLVDQTGQDQQYVEDCSVCCRPILVCVRVDNEEVPVISLYHENEVPNP